MDLGEAVAIEANVEKLRAALRDRKRAASGDVATVKEAARAVDEQVMRPVRGLLGATRRIFLSPDGALNLIPFGALLDERGKYLVEDYTLTYLTSGRDLLRLQVTVESKQPPLVLANPLFDDNGNSKAETLAVAAKRGIGLSASDFSNLLYSPLPGTAEEAKALSALMPDARMLTGAEATEAALKQLHSPRILHVATHGFFHTDQPHQAENSGRGVGLGTSQNDLLALAGTVRNENPLLRSGLILAGVNQRRSGTNEDGVLTAAEAAALDLWGTKLVVLSACETGLGDVKNGDGRVRLAPRFGLSGQRKSGDEPLASVGRGHAGFDDSLLRTPATQRRAHRGAAASSVGNDSRRPTKAPVLLGQLYPVGRVDELKIRNEPVLFAAGNIFSPAIGEGSPRRSGKLAPEGHTTSSSWLSTTM